MEINLQIVEDSFGIGVNNSIEPEVYSKSSGGGGCCCCCCCCCCCRGGSNNPMKEK